MRPILSMLAVLGLVALLFTPAMASEEGQSLYKSKCSICRGKDGVAKKMAKGSANLNDPEWQKATTLETIQQGIAEGKGKMPGFGEKLDADQIKLIAEYVKPLK